MSASPARLLVVLLLGVAPPLLAQGGGRIEGTVVDVLGEPIPKAAVMIEFRGSEPVRATCDASGRFVAGGLPRSAKRITARADGHCARSELLEPVDGDLDACLRIELLDSVRVVGHVLDAKGKPLADAHVLVDAHRKVLESSDTHAVTDAEGRYVLPNVPAGSVELIVLAAHHAASTASMTLRQSETRNFELSKGETATYRVAVEGVESDDLAGVRVSCRHRFSGTYGNWHFGEIWPRTRDGNVIVLAHVPVDLELESMAIHVGSNWAKPKWDAMPRSPGTHSFAMKAVSEHDVGTPAIVRGIVRDAGGKPMAGLRIANRTWRVDDEAATATDGSFALTTSIADGDRVWLRLVGSDDYILRTDERDLRSVGVLVVAHDPDLVHPIVVDETARVTGTLVDADGTPVGGAEVRLLVDADQLRSNRKGYPDEAIASTRSRGNGTFTLSGLDPRLGLDTWLAVSSPTGHLSRGPWRFEPGQHIALGEVRLPRVGSIEGVYVDEDGEVRAGFPVRLHLRDATAPATSYWSAVTDRDGRFRFSGLAEGNYTVRPYEPFAMRWTPGPDFARVTLRAGDRITVRRGDVVH